MGEFLDQTDEIPRSRRDLRMTDGGVHHLGFSIAVTKDGDLRRRGSWAETGSVQRVISLGLLLRVLSEVFFLPFFYHFLFPVVLFRGVTPLGPQTIFLDQRRIFHRHKQPSHPSTPQSKNPSSRVIPPGDRRPGNSETDRRLPFPADSCEEAAAK